LDFFANLNSYDDEVALAFAMTYDGLSETMYWLLFPIPEATISIATRLQRIGERWFKHQSL
jgi:hypothetical protein